MQSEAVSDDSRTNYRWYILTLVAMTATMAVAMPLMSIPVLFKEISEDLNLSLVQLGTVWGIANAAGVFVLLIGGLLADRFGVRLVLTVACFLGGLAGALRGLADGFISLTVTMFLFGLATAIIPIILHKTCAVWFSGRHLGLANGAVAIGMAVGFTLGALISATILSPLLGNWRNVMFLYGAISVVISILWCLSRNEPGKTVSSPDFVTTLPFRQALYKVVRIRNVWVLGFILLGQLSCVQGMLGYLPLYLRQVGWTPVSADGAVAAFNGISMVAVIPIVLLSYRLGSKRIVLFAGTLLTAIGVGLLSLVSGPLVYAAVLLAGIVRDGYMAVYMTTIIESEEIGAVYAGTAIGLATTVARLGVLFSPPIGNSLAGIGTGVPFTFWAGLAFLALFGFFFLKKQAL